MYEDAENELKYVIEECIKIQKSIVESKTEQHTDYITLFNPSSFEQGVHFIYDKPARVFDGDKQIDCAKTFDGTYVYDSDEKIPGLGLGHLELQIWKMANWMMKQICRHKKRVSNYSMENEKLKVIVNEDGSVNVFNKPLGKWAFEHAGNLLTVYGDVHAYWENWDIDVRSKGSERRLSASKIELVEKNALRQVIRVLYTFDSSTVEAVLRSGKG